MENKRVLTWWILAIGALGVAGWMYAAYLQDKYLENMEEYLGFLSAYAHSVSPYITVDVTEESVRIENRTGRILGVSVYGEGTFLIKEGTARVFVRPSQEGEGK